MTNDNLTTQQSVKRLPNGAKLIASSAWRWASKAGQETMISRIVLAELTTILPENHLYYEREEKEYVTWQEIQEIDCFGNPIRPSTVDGHYFQDMPSADTDFQDRARNLIKRGGARL